MAGADPEVTEDRAVGAMETPTPMAATEAMETPMEDTEAATEVGDQAMAATGPEGKCGVNHEGPQGEGVGEEDPTRLSVFLVIS